jgi:hypothetical protein
VGREPLKEYAKRYNVVIKGIKAVKEEIARLKSEYLVLRRRSKA